MHVVKSSFGLSKVHITGGEPLVRLGRVDLVSMLAAEDVGDLALTTNGERLASMAADLKRAGLRRVNVSLDSVDDATFTALTRGARLRQVFDGIDAALREGLVPLKLNAVVMRGYNDSEVTRLAQWALDRGLCMRFLELMPIGCVSATHQDLFVPVSEVKAQLAESFTLDPLPSKPGASSREFSACDNAGRRGVIGFITPQTEPFCDGCRRLRLTSTGRVISCLATGRGPNVKEFLRDGAPSAGGELQKILAMELSQKCARDTFDTDRAMVTVGG